MPESSASAGMPVARAALSAFSRALSSNVSPVSGGSSTWSGSGTSSCPGRRAASSRTLCGLREARTSFTTVPASDRQCADRLLLRRAQALYPRSGEGEQLVERCARERRPLGSGLDLDEATVPRHHHVHVDLRGGVLAV